MKKLIPLFSAMLFFSAAFGQIEWVYDNPDLHSYSEKLFKTKSNQYVLFHGNSTDSPIMMSVVDSSGALVYNANISGFPSGTFLSNLNDLIELPDGSLALAATVGGVDGGGTGNFNGAILKLDNIGNISNYISVNQTVGPSGAALSDGSFVLWESYNFSILNLTSDGSLVWDIQLMNYNMSDLKITDSDSIIIAAVEGLVVLDKNGIIANEYPGFSFEQIKLNGQNGFVGTRGDSIFLLSLDYTLSASAGFPIDKIRDYAVSDGFISVLTESEKVFRYDSSLSFLDSFQLQGDEEFRFIANKVNGHVLAGQEQYSLNNQYDITISPFIKEYAFDGDDYGLSNDVGVTGIELGTEAEIFNTGGNNYSVVLKDVKVAIRNFGLNAIDSLYLRAPQYRSQKFKNLFLQPGEEKELIWEEIGQLVYSPTYPSGQTLHLCIWTSHPDLRLDTDASNDKACVDFLVSSGEATQPGGGFSIFPNPSSSQSTIQYWLPAAAQGEARIFDSLGRQVAVYCLAGGDGVVVLPQLPKGVYFVALYSEGNVVAQRKLVQI